MQKQQTVNIRLNETPKLPKRSPW